MTIKHKISIPENISEITLRQFLAYEDKKSMDMDSVMFNRHKIRIFTGIPFKDTGIMNSADFNRLSDQIDAALSAEAEFTPLFNMHDIEFGFIPNLDKITIGEYGDLSLYGVENETLHNLMAVLFRPVIKKDGDKYEIMPYNGSEEYAEMMKDMPLSCVQGALVFFWNLANELQEATQKCLTEELLKEIQPPITSRLSGGIQRLRDWLRTTSLTYQRLRS